jgi:rubrerythrin
MTNIYLKIRWGSALLIGIILVLTGVVGLFVPLVPEIAVILLGMWLLGAAAVNPLGRWRLHQREEQHHNTTPLNASVVAAFLLSTVLYGCQEKTPEPEKVKPTVTIENLHTAYAKEVNRQQKYTRFIKRAEKDRLPGVANLYRAVARSEGIHAANHATLLRSQGVEPTPSAKDSVIIGNTLQTLKMAMSGERVEVESLYPNLIQTAELDKYPEAVEHFKKTRSADVRHLELFKEALEKKGRIKMVQYVVCARCGYIVTSQKIETCPNCGAKKDSLEKI